YSTVATAFFLLLLAKTANILALAARSKKNRYAQVIYRELDDDQTAFSFFGFLFINPSALEKDTIIRHELIHITQKHSLDVMLFELIQIISWFNPVIYLYKKDIKLLHEYIADELTTRVAVPKHEYAMLLIQNSFGAQSNALTNQIFNQSVLKKRISMLNKQKSGTNARLKMLLALPLAGGLICLSTMAFTKDYTVLDLYPVNQVIQEPTKVSPPPPPKEPRVSNVKRKKAGRTGTYVSPPPPPPPIETPRVSNVRRKKASKTGTYVTPPPPIEAPKVKEKMLPPPPPVEAPPARKVKKAKQDQVKFPPPIVKGN
ncbi:MAG: M56 family metallopeptidase, partial [Chryseobacterium sp.]